jgi:hypothetical protein
VFLLQAGKLGLKITRVVVWKIQSTRPRACSR